MAHSQNRMDVDVIVSPKAVEVESQESELESDALVDSSDMAHSQNCMEDHIDEIDSSPKHDDAGDQVGIQS